MFFSGKYVGFQDVIETITTPPQGGDAADLPTTLGHSWMVENPSSSCLLLHPWLQWAINLIQKFGGSDT